MSISNPSFFYRLILDDNLEIKNDAKGNRAFGFTAGGTNESEINYYTWDFDYDEKKGFKSLQLIDKIGNTLHTFSAGSHTIAVKVVDNEGLENVEVVKLKVNGGVRKQQSEPRRNRKIT